MGHIGGDDFAVIVVSELAEAVAEEVIKRWERFGSGLFDDDDLERGYIDRCCHQPLSPVHQQGGGSRDSGGDEGARQAPTGLELFGRSTPRRHPGPAVARRMRVTS